MSEPTLKEAIQALEQYGVSVQVGKIWGTSCGKVMVILDGCDIVLDSDNHYQIVVEETT